MKTESHGEALVVSVMRAIELGDVETVYCLIKDMQGINISEPERRGKLPKKVHHVASSCITTPLRMCISWRRIKLLEDLLHSECLITQHDKNLALQKILSSSRRQLGRDELDIIRILIQNGAVVRDVIHLANTMYSAFGVGQEAFHNLVDTILEHGNNEQKGLLLLAFYLRDRNPHPSGVSNAPHVHRVEYQTRMNANASNATGHTSRPLDNTDQTSEITDNSITSSVNTDDVADANATVADASHTSRSLDNADQASEITDNSITSSVNTDDVADAFNATVADASHTSRSLDNADQASEITDNSITSSANTDDVATIPYPMQSDTNSWDTETQVYIEKIYLSGFNPTQFLHHQTMTKAHIGRLVQALPRLLQLSATVDQMLIGQLLHEVAFHFPLINLESRHILRRLCKLLIYMGYDIGVINSVAKNSTRFNKVLGFTDAERQPRFLTLQERSRICIRNSITEANVLLGVQQLGLPERVRNYLLLKELFNF